MKFLQRLQTTPDCENHDNTKVQWKHKTASPSQKIKLSFDEIGPHKDQSINFNRCCQFFMNFTWVERYPSVSCTYVIWKDLYNTNNNGFNTCGSMLFRTSSQGTKTTYCVTYVFINNLLTQKLYIHFSLFVVSTACHNSDHIGIELSLTFTLCGNNKPRKYVRPLLTSEP